MSGYFVTGTDTGVGKTLVSCGLLQALAERGLKVVGMKPVAAGARLEEGRLVNDDVQAIRAAGNVDAHPDLVNPYCFAQGIAPHIAAAEAGVSIDLEQVKTAYAGLAALADRVIVEGAGGFEVPLGPGSSMADVAAGLGLPVILVVGMRLGCLNHALLTARAVASSGLRLAGWVANHIDRDMPYADENVEALSARLPAPLLARIPWSQGVDASHVARELRAAVETLEGGSSLRKL